MAEEANEAKKTDAEGSAKKNLMMLAAMALGVVVLTSAGGFMAAKMTLGPAQAHAEPAEASSDHGAATKSDSHGSDSHGGGGHGSSGELDGEWAYFHFEPIVVNLNEPRLARYVRATLLP